MKEKTTRKRQSRSSPYWTDGVMGSASPSPRYGKLDTLPPSREYMRTLKPVALGRKKDLTREGIEPNPGPFKQGGPKSAPASLASSSDRKGKGPAQAAPRQGKKQWRAKQHVPGGGKDTLDQLADLTAQLAAADDPRRARLFDKREERDDKRWKWECKRMKHTLWRERQERKDGPAAAAHEQARREHERWKEAQEMEAERREAEAKAKLEENALKAAEERLTAIFETLRGMPIDYFWVEKCQTTKIAIKLLIGAILSSVFGWIFTMVHMAMGEDILLIPILAGYCAATYCVWRLIKWLLWEVGGVRNSFHFLPDEGAMVEWDLRPDAQAVGENKHTNPLYTTGHIRVKKGGLLGKIKTSSHLISLELLAQLLNPNALDIDASFVEKRGRIARLARTCHSINLNRFHNVIKSNVVEDTAYFALAAIMDRERRIEHVPFRIPLSQAVPASAPTWRA